jgi:hypothetical protein
MAEEAVQIAVEEGVSLEGRYTPGAGAGAALVLHPHPQYGGSMYNNVVEALVEAAAGAGWAGLRFNFRGVGLSTGSFDQGRGERADALAAAGWLLERAGGPLALLGYSFGSLVGAQAAARAPELAGGLWVAPPLVLGELPPWPEGAGPLLMLAGTADAFTDLGALERYAQGLGARGRLITLPGADHFLWGLESALTDKAQSFLQGLEG